MTEIRVLIVEDDPLIAEDIATALANIDYAVAGVAYDEEEALQVLDTVHPDIAILDINLNGGHEGIALAQLINQKYRLPFIYLTSYGDKATLELAKKTDPSGYLVKPFSEANLYASLHLAMHAYAQKNKANYPDLVLALINARLNNALSEREFEVLQLIYAGVTNQEIAQRLFVSVNTIKKHINNAYLKLDVANRGSAIARLRGLMQHA
jgi:DNA-binding NarL/FixJ family response regulator